jgi:predicted PurR-regulated permease PerM
VQEIVAPVSFSVTSVQGGIVAGTTDTQTVLSTVSLPPKPLAVRLATISRTLVLLSVLATVAACYFARDILAAVVLSLLLSLLLSPLVNAIEKFRVPRVLASGIAVLLIVACMLGGLVALAQPARDWIGKAPSTLHSIQERLTQWRGSIQQAQKATETFESLAHPAEAPAQNVVVVKDQPGLVATIVNGTPRVLETIAIVILLLFFCLSSGDNFLRRLVEVAPGMSEKRTVVTIARDVQREMSRYLLTITLINFGLGCATAVALACWGVPNALLWGALVFVLHFAPIVGAAVTASVLAMVGFSTFDDISHALALPATFLFLAFIEGQLVTPTVIGRRLGLNPVVVFVWLLLWGALWGVIGILLAGPMLACFRIICEHTQALRPIYMLIGESRAVAANGH